MTSHVHFIGGAYEGEAREVEGVSEAQLPQPRPRLVASRFSKCPISADPARRVSTRFPRFEVSSTSLFRCHSFEF